MFKPILREWRNKVFWILLFLSLVTLFCVYWITLPSPVFINVGTEGDERYLSNFNFREQSELYPFRWTKDSSHIKIPDLGSLPLEITLGADAPRPEGQPLPRVSLTANGTLLADFTMQNVLYAHRFLYHPPLFPLPSALLIEIKSDTFVPPGDSRALGIILNTVEVKPIVSTLRLLQVSLLASLIGAFPIAIGYLLLRRLGLSQKVCLICGLVVLALLGLGIAQRFIVPKFLIGFGGLTLVGYVLAMLLEARGGREARKPAQEAESYSFASPKRNQISDVLPAYLPAVVLFVLMPFALFLPNQDVFNNNLTLVLPYLVLAVVYFVFLIALFLVGQPLRTRIVIVLFYVGVYLSLSDVMAPVQLGELMGGRETPSEPFFLTAVEVALAVVIIFGAIRLPWKHVKSFGSIFVLVLLVSEVIIVYSGLSPDTKLPFVESGENTLSNDSEKLIERGNIYHITLDSYSSVTLLESLEKMKLAGNFDGFTFFEKTRSNYMFTELSLPSYMTGSLYEENESLKEWMNRHKSSGIVNKLHDAGYEVSMYIPSSGWAHPKASHIKVNEDVLMRYKSLPSFCHFADLWLLRVVPNFLQQEVYREGEGIFTRLFVQDDRLAGNNAYVFGSVELMRQLINDEADRPDHGQYVYAHLYIPHDPYIMNRDCVFSPDCGYNEQALCATRLMAELVSELKQLGRYHESTIIFQSDHGPAGIIDPDSEMSLDIKERIEALNPRGFRVGQVESRTLALLLIKPPSQSGKPLIVSDRPTQLVDIPATLYDLIDLPVHTKDGESVFSPDFPQNREIHIFSGLIIQTKDGKEYRFGENLFEGEANHLSFTKGKGWKIYPNISVRWE
jgi:hypothetical protein